MYFINNGYCKEDDFILNASSESYKYLVGVVPEMSKDRGFFNFLFQKFAKCHAVEIKTCCKSTFRPN